MILNPSYQPLVQRRCVARVDIFGAKSLIEKDLSHAAGWVCTLQAAGVEALENCPHVDLIASPQGMYAVANALPKIEGWLRRVFASMSDRLQGASLLPDVEPFLIVGAMGEGDIARGDSLSAASAPGFDGHVAFRDSIYVGSIFTELERLAEGAPPLGISLHHSLSTNSNTWWPWWPPERPVSADIARKVFTQINHLANGATPLLDTEAHQEALQRAQAYLNHRLPVAQ